MKKSFCSPSLCLLSALALLGFAGGPRAQAAGTIAAGDQFAGAINANDTDNGYGGGDNQLRTWGANNLGQLGRGSTTTPLVEPSRVDDTFSYMKVVAGPDFMFGLNTSGTLRAWGSNVSGQLGIGDEDTELVDSPQNINFPLNGGLSPAIENMAAGSAFGLAIDAGDLLYAWGDNGAGQLGINWIGDPEGEAAVDLVVESPVPVVSLDEDALNTWKDVAAGANFSVGIKTDGTLWIWGGQAQGDLGLPTSSDFNFTVPSQLGTASNWTQVEAGLAHIIALNENGAIYTWGSNAVGQLGFGDFVSRTTPTLVPGKSNWVAIGAGDLNSYAIDDAGVLYGWGLNLDEQLGQEVSFIPQRNIYLPSPTVMAEGNVFYEVTGCKSSSNCFTLARGTVSGQYGVYSFGSNTQGQLGIGKFSYTTEYTPQRTASDGVSLSVGAPEILSTSDLGVGVNSTIQVQVLVTNDSPVAITGGYSIDLYLSANNEIRNSDQPLATETVADTLASGEEKKTTFSTVEIADLNSGTYYLIARVTLTGGLIDSSAEDNLASLAITVVRPDFRLGSLAFPDGTTIDSGATFDNVSLTLSNNTVGVLPPATAEGVVPAVLPINLEVYLIENLNFDPLNDTFRAVDLMYAQVYADGLGPVNAQANDPSPTYDFTGLTLDPSQIVSINEDGNVVVDPDAVRDLGGREDFLVVFAINRTGDVGEETGSTDDNFILQQVKIESPNPVGPGLDYGVFTGLGRPGEWASVSDLLAQNGSALQSPILSVPGDASFTLDVYGPTTINAPWLIDGDDDDRVYFTLTDADGDVVQAAGGGDFTTEISGYRPFYLPQLVIVDAQSDLYDGGDYPYPWTIAWTYEQNSTYTGYARVDVEVPSFVPDPGTLAFQGLPDSTAPVGLLSAQSPADITSGDTAVVRMDFDFTDPALVKFWWRSVGEDSDSFTFLVDGETRKLPTEEFGETADSAIISGNVGWQQVAIIVAAGPHTLRWEYAKSSADTIMSQGFIDGLQVLEPIPSDNDINRENPDPALLPTFGGLGAWAQISDPLAPNDMAVEILGGAPVVPAATFTYTGPDREQVVFAPWLISGAVTDELIVELFDANGDPILAAGSTQGSPVPFVQSINGATNAVYVDVNVVMDRASSLYEVNDTWALAPYPWQARWTYTQAVADAAAFARVAPTPYNFSDVPLSNVDMAITSVQATPGTYILDDAQGTGRLPVSVAVENVGADFISNPSWDPTNLQINLSIDQVFGNEDDVALGNFAQVEVLDGGDQIVFEADINLPFHTPAGNYYLLLRFDSSFNSGEYTYANNSSVVGPNFIIVRAPNLVIENELGFSATYPYRPEQSSYIRYDIANTGLGDITEDEPFDVQVSLYATSASDPDVTNAILMKNYAAIPHRLFLPQASATFPEVSASQITHFVDLPPLRDLLVSLGVIPNGIAEDDVRVYTNQFRITDFVYFFTVTVDVNEDIVESSDTNTHYVLPFFPIIPVDLLALDLNDQEILLPAENYGIYVGHSPFTRFTVRSTNSLTNPYGDADGDGNLNIQEYAFATNPTAATELFVRQNQNGVIRLNVPPFGDDGYLSITFDFNVRAADIQLLVQAADDILGPWDTLVTLEPPYLDSSGPQSLTGTQGLSSNPRVVSVEGNVSDVQKVYSARVTVRDVVPYDSINSRFMRVKVDPTADTEPVEPTDLDAGIEGDGNGVVITWNGVAYDEDAGLNSAFHIERSTLPDSDYKLIGITNISDPDNDDAAKYVDTTVQANRTYYYRVRTVGTSGVTAYAIDPSTGLRYVSITLSTN